jgi:hypothetical protein
LPQSRDMRRKSFVSYADQSVIETTLTNFIPAFILDL